MLIRERKAVNCEKEKKHTHYLGRRHSFWYLKHVVYIVSIEI
jgi:hypothetical protein